MKALQKVKQVLNKREFLTVLVVSDDTGREIGFEIEPDFETEDYYMEQLLDDTEMLGSMSYWSVRNDALKAMLGEVQDSDPSEFAQAELYYRTALSSHALAYLERCGFAQRIEDC